MSHVKCTDGKGIVRGGKRAGWELSVILQPGIRVSLTPFKPSHLPSFYVQGEHINTHGHIRFHCVKINPFFPKNVSLPLKNVGGDVHFSH